MLYFIKENQKTNYSNLNVKDIVDSKKFWKTVKSFFSDKLHSFEILSLIENGNPPAADFEIEETFNKYFQNLVPESDPKVTRKLLCQTPEMVMRFKSQYVNTRITQVSK